MRSIRRSISGAMSSGRYGLTPRAASAVPDAHRPMSIRIDRAATERKAPADEEVSTASFRVFLPMARMTYRIAAGPHRRRETFENAYAHLNFAGECGIFPRVSSSERAVFRRGSTEFRVQVGVLVPRACRCLVRLAAVAAVFLVAAPVPAQLPSDIQAQARAFSQLPAAEQQRVLRSLESILPPGERDAILGPLLEQQRLQRQVDLGVADPGSADLLADEPGFGFELEEVPPVFRAGDSLLIELEETDAPGNAQVRERLRNANPYRLDDAGRLYLPGIPPIELAGLSEDVAALRLAVVPELGPFDVTVTRLDLEAVGEDALELFGHDFFDDVPSTFAQVRTIPAPVGYVMGPGDALNVRFFGSQNLTHFLPVDPDGTISIPGLAPINVTGLTFDDARTLISDRVTEALIGVTASTTLGELRSIEVSVFGDVVRPGSYTVSSLARIINALFASGGVSEIGSLRRIELVRGGETVTTLDLYDPLLRGDTSNDARLLSGDTIFVPPIGPTVAIDGEVRRPAIYEVNGESVDELIAMAGGLRPGADLGAARLERIVAGSGTTVIDLDLAATGGQTPVRDGDAVRIAPTLQRLSEAVRLDGNVQRPGNYPWRPGMTVSDLLRGPEDVKPVSDLGYVLIRRESRENVEVDAFSVDIEAVWQGRLGAADLALEPRDTVYVFHLETGRQQYMQPIIEEISAQIGPGESAPVVRVGGQVRAQGDYPLEPGMRVGDLVRAGGGLRDSAYTGDAELARYRVANGETRQTELVTINLEAALAGDPAADLALAPYDYLLVKEIASWRGEQSVTLGGEVMHPGTYPFYQGELLSSVIERAGGLTAFAFPEGAVFTRVEQRQREIEQIEAYAQRLQTELASTGLAEQGAADVLETGESLLNQLRNATVTGRLPIRLQDIIAGNLDTDIELREGDELLVPERRQEVAMLGEVQYRTSHIYERGLALEDYIDRSGGLTRRADNRQIYVVRANGEVVSDQGRRWFRSREVFEIRPGDTIVVPLEVNRLRPLDFWRDVTQVLYNLAVAAAAVASF